MDSVFYAMANAKRLVIMKIKLLLISSVLVTSGCAVEHVHHFNKSDLPGCNCNAGAQGINGGHSLPVDYSKAKILPPIYQSVQPGAQSRYGQPMYPQPMPQPKVQMPEYFKLSPVDPNEARKNPTNQQQISPAMQSPTSYYQPTQYQQPPVPQAIMPISMNRSTEGKEDSNIRTYLFQPAGGVVFQY